MKNKYAAVSLVLPGLRTALGLIMALALSFLLTLTCEAQAWANSKTNERPSVLLIDAGIGDYSQFAQLWMGDAPEEIASNGKLSLVTSANPAWWTADANGAGAPATFLLGSSTANSSVTADDIVWALDQIRESGAQPKTFVFAMGTPGLALREYVEDLASTKQSERADIVGVAFCATPHNGYSIMASYPELEMWDAIAQAGGKSRSDLEPNSDYLGKLNAAAFPQTVKAFSMAGAIGDLGFGETDGAGVAQDYELATTVTERIQTGAAKATLGQTINLTNQWQRFTDEISYRDRMVDPKLTELLSSSVSYATSEEVVGAVRDFYNTWFSNGAPVTHISNALALDLSGSMKEEIEPGSVKIDGAKNAAREYLRAVQAFESMPYASPVSIDITGFSTSLENITSGYDDAARSAIANMEASNNETNIGIALTDALEKLSSSPTCSDKRILLLSDGASTEGMSNEEMLSGPIAEAASKGIVVDAIGFGDVGESNSTFLGQIADATGGTYYQATDTYELEVNFLRSYYTSLGLDLIDEELPAGDTKTFDLGSLDSSALALGIGVVGKDFTPKATIKCDGADVDPGAYSTQEEGKFIALQYANPTPGAYTLDVTGGSEPAHLFVVTQRGKSNVVEFAGAQTDNSLLLLIGTGVVLALGIIALVVRTLSKKKAA